MNSREPVQLPRWVYATWHAAALGSFLLLALLVYLSIQTSASTGRTEVIMGAAVAELRTLNLFFDSTLAAAQRRADSLRTIQQRRLDSLESRGR